MKKENDCILHNLEISSLEKLHTKQLINKLRTHKHCLSTYCSDYCKYFSTCKKIRNENITKIKNILKNRPHILNKKESKELRKARIKKGN